MKVHVQLGHGFDAADYGERYRRGETNDESPFGFHLAQKLVDRMTFSTDREGRSDGRVLRWVQRKLRFDVLHAWHNRRSIAACDVVWTMAEGDAFSVALLMKARLIPRRPIVANAIWLFDQWDSLSPISRSLFRLLSDYLDVMTVHSAACLPVAARALPHKHVELTYFGINLESYPLTEPQVDRADGPIRILVAGNDGTRDWDTAIRAFGNDSRFRFSAWTKALDADDRGRIGNLMLPKPDTMEAIRRLYLESDVVVVPMKDNLFSGITVALEAVALGRPVVSTRTGGVPTYFGADEVTYVPVGDPAALRDAVLGADADRLGKARAAQARLVRSGYTTQAVIERYVALSRPLLAGDA